MHKTTIGMVFDVFCQCEFYSSRTEDIYSGGEAEDELAERI
jgi:hypothetical protein